MYEYISLVPPNTVSQMSLNAFRDNSPRFPQRKDNSDKCQTAFRPNTIVGILSFIKTSQATTIARDFRIKTPATIPVLYRRQMTRG